MAKARNYRREYKQRLKRALAKGLTRAEARGHASKKTSKRRTDALDKALRAMMERAASLTKAARRFHIAPESLRQFLRQHTEAKFEGRRWAIKDRRAVDVLIAVDGRLKTVTVSRKAASAVGEYWNAVGRFLRSNRKSDLAAIQGRSVRDVHAKRHRLEDRPNALRRLDASGELSFLSIYADAQPEAFVP